MTTVAKRKPSKTRNRTGKKEAVITGKRLRQRQFISAFTSNGFHIGKACGAAGVARCTFADWKDSDPAFLQEFQDAVDTRLDDLETALHQAAVGGDSTCLIFTLKCLAKHRGYSEHNISKQAAKLLQQAQDGTISAKDAAFEFAKLGLPLPEILALELKRTVEVDLHTDFTPISEEELEKRAADRLAAIEKQREQFLPERRAEVAEIKNRLKDQDSFAPERFEGE